MSSQPDGRPRQAHEPGNEDKPLPGGGVREHAAGALGNWNPGTGCGGTPPPHVPTVPGASTTSARARASPTPSAWNNRAGALGQVRKGRWRDAPVDHKMFGLLLFFFFAIAKFQQSLYSVSEVMNRRFGGLRFFKFITRVAPHCVNRLMIQHVAHTKRDFVGLN